MDGLKILAFLLTIAVGIKCQNMTSGPLPPMQMAHRVTLDQMGKYVLRWTPGKDEIVFEVHVATTGYVGLGFSPNGGMKGSDIIIGGVDDTTKEVYLKDRSASGNEVPKVDDTQNVKLLAGQQNDTHTILRFSRPWITCDNKGDMDLSKEDTTRIIWAYGTSDPSKGDPMAISYHTQRGTKSLFLNEPRLQMPNFGSDVQTWDLRSPNITLPNDLKTLYWCKMFKVPPLPRKTHVIGYVPLIASDNIQHVHHILIYECYIPESAKYFEKWVDVKGTQCFGANMPVSWKYCTTPIVAWAIGSEGGFTPDHVGYPLGEQHGGSTYFMMELHYDNPNLKRGVVDNSGIRIFHTENLRPNDAGILIVGHSVSPIQIVPPGREWMSVGICSSNCTKENIPWSGIKIFAGFLHAHLLGRNMTVRHIRSRKELPVIQRDLSYDFNFQEARNLKKELTVYPGDSFITECGLDSRSRSVPTFGGIGTEEEMCLGFFYYYPRVNLSYCVSGPSRANVFKNLGISEVYPPKQAQAGTVDKYGIDEASETKLAQGFKSGNVTSNPIKLNLAEIFRLVVVKSPSKFQNQTLFDILTSRDTWKDADFVQKFQEAVIRGDHAQTCEQKTDVRGGSLEITEEEIINYPNFQPLQTPREKCKTVNEVGVTGATGATGGILKPLPCPARLPGCNQYRSANNILGNRPSFF
ncbi:DBH-like monooxygenase protein 1 [Macrobrachium nipponense]|uniref:DBH-like monooxygenase protein 1 n=1 Tax=Macrobrachium nipponense TaxID=159736 RepID=UPI0030C7E6ED